MVHDLLRRALGDDLPTVHAGPRSDVHHVVGQADGIFVVFHHDHRVAQVAQVVEGGKQAVIVSLMKADGRFIKDIHHPHKTSADLAGQADSLRLATGQRIGAAVQGEIVETDVDQELQALADFLEDLRRNLATATGQGQLAEIIAGFTNRQVGHRRQGLLAHPHVPCLSAQTGAAAIWAGLGAKELGQFFTHGGRFGLPVATFQVRYDAFEGVRALDDVASVVEVLEVDALLAAALQDHLLVLGRQLAERLLQAEAVVRGQRTQHLEVVHVAPVPAADRAFGQGELGIDQALGVEELLHPQAIAGRAGAGGVVEGEQLRLQLADGMATDRAGETRGEDRLFALFVIHRCHQGDPVGQLERGLERLGQALLQVGADLEAVHHHIDAVFFLLVQLGQFVEFIEFAVDPSAHKALGAQLVEHCQMLALALAHNGRQQHQFAAFRALQHQVYHLADRLRFQRDIVIRAAWSADAGVQQAQVVVDFGDGANRGAGVVGGRLLLDGNGWRQAFDGVDVGLFHHRQELPGVGRQRFHIAALAFGVQGVERQGRLAGTGQAGDHDQLVPGQGQVDVLQVVGTCPTNQDLVHCGLARRA